MRCHICGSDEGTGGCTTPWKHGPTMIGGGITFAPAAPPRNDELASALRDVRAALDAGNGAELARLRAEVENYRSTVVALDAEIARLRGLFDDTNASRIEAALRADRYRSRLARVLRALTPVNRATRGIVQRTRAPGVWSRSARSTRRSGGAP